jgi:hypothetical protein
VDKAFNLSDVAPMGAFCRLGYSLIWGKTQSSLIQAFYSVQGGKSETL